MRFLVGMMLICMSPIVRAQPTESIEDGTAPPATPTTNRLNMRFGGATSDDTGRPTICLDVRIIAGFSLESCGTGQAIIHNEPGREMAHFRGTWTFLEKQTSRGVGKLRAGAGFAELQVGQDHPGFNFGEPDDVDRGSVAGPEAVVQAQWMVPLGVGIEAVTSLTAGLAFFAEAEKLIIPQDNVQPFVSFEIGVGW
ncbi:MAG: hypothetical protein M4D80_09480 [Myxococcota bacterium]|nr:hypothetical protein [Myxococcota bacterium]